MEIKKPNPYKEITEKPKNCGTRKEVNDQGIYEKFPQDLYKIRWKYITNKSGSREFFFTGTEIDAEQTKFAENKSINPGDIVILNKKGHPNDGIKAKIKKVTKKIKGLEAEKKGITENDKKNKKYYDLKFIHPPVINLKRVKYAKEIEEKYLKKIFVKKTYVCIPSYYNEEKLREEFDRFANLNFTKGTPFIPQQILAMDSETRSKKTLQLDKLIEPQEKDKFKILRSNYISHSLPKWNKKKTHKNVEVLVRIDLISESTGIGSILTNTTSYLNCGTRQHQLKTDLKSVAKDIKNKISIDFFAPEPEWKIKDDDIPMKKDDDDEGKMLERKDSDPPKRNKKGGAVSNQIIQNIENKMDDIVNEPQDPLTNILGGPPPATPAPPAAPAPMDIIEDEDEDDAAVPPGQFSPGDEVIFQGNRYRILRVDGINNNGIREYTIVPIDTNIDPMMTPRDATGNELTLATATPEPPLWERHLLMTPAQQAWLEEDQEGGGLTKEEIQKWFEYFENEINENDDSAMDDFSLPTLSKEENETLLKFF